MYQYNMMSTNQTESKKTSSNKPIQLGLCCLNMTLRGQKPTVFTSRKMVVKSIIEQGIDPLKEKIVQNLNDLIKMIEWNEQNGIKVFRLSSELFPHKTNPLVPSYTFDFAESFLSLRNQFFIKFSYSPNGKYQCVVSFSTGFDPLIFEIGLINCSGLNELPQFSH